MKKRILSIVLTLCMVLMLLPTTVFAANSDTAELQNLLNGGGTVTLIKDYTIDTTLNVTNTVTLDLNGHTITMTGSGSVIFVASCNLTLQDSNKTAIHTDTSLPAGGVITGGNATQGGGVYVVSGGSMTMNGGTIANCSVEYGGGVYINSNSTFTMNGGTIANCKATTSNYALGGGGVYVAKNSNFTMSGGIIENCSAAFTFGGGVFSYGNFSMSGNAIIRGCSAKYAGGVNFEKGDIFTMTGGTIEDCTATKDGESDAVKIAIESSLLANGGIVKGTVIFSANSTINTTSTDSYTKFYNEVTNYGTIYGGVYYGGISGSGTVSGTCYTVSFDTNGGSFVPTQWLVNTTTAKAPQPADPTKDGYQAFDGWYNGDTKYDFTQPVTQDITLTAKFSNPKAYNISYDLDGGTATNPATYTVESDAITLNNPTKTGYTFTGWSGTGLTGENNMTVTIAKGSTGNRTYTALWKDIENPVITGLENGKIYCGAVEFEVSDNDGIASVKVGDEVLTAGTNGKYTLAKGIGTVTVVATDKAGNVSAEMIVTVNDGHTYEWQEDNGQYWKKCKFCDDETAKKDIPTITINGADAVCVTQDYKFSFTLPEGATDAESGYEFTNMGAGINLTAENGTYSGVLESQFYDENESSFKLKAYAKTTDGFVFSAEKTVAIQNEHAGGVATCVESAICDTCGEHYGELDSTNHNLEKIPAKSATVTENGNKEYWHCKDCGKYFADEKGTNEIKLDDTVISKLSPEIIDGKGQSLTAGEKKELTFRSNAEFSDFIRAQLDGKELDAKYYTVKEGSTIVTLKEDFVTTLSAGEHTIGIVSTNGTATTTFTINAKTAVDNDTKSPKTGDNSHMALWIVLLFVSGGAVATTGVIKKKKRGKH